MRYFAIVIDLLHWLGLALWLAVLVGAGIAAMGAFTGLPAMRLVMPEFVTYLDGAGASAAEHGRIAAGMMMEPVFTTTEFAQIVLAAVVLITLAVQVTTFQWRWPLTRPSNILRAVCIVGATGLVAYHTNVMAPTMNGSLRQWWSAARLNDPVAAEHRSRFQAHHEVSDQLFRLRLAFVLVAIGATAVAGVPLEVRGRTLKSPPAAVRPS